MTGTAVVALGGNAITAEGEAGTYDQQRANADAMAHSICELLDDGWRVVIVHGNGPQVGNLAIQQDRGRDSVPQMPLFALGAMTQGQLGRSSRSRCTRPAAGVITSWAYSVTSSSIRTTLRSRGRPSRSGRSSPRRRRRGSPRATDGRSSRTAAADTGASSLHRGPEVWWRSRRSAACWTPGMSWWPTVAEESRSPVREMSGPAWMRSSTRTTPRQSWPYQIDADVLVLVTGVDSVMVDFGTDAQRRLGRVDVAEAERQLAAGQFPEGSMGPKMRAATRFVRRGGRLAVVTTAALAAATLRFRARRHLGRYPDRADARPRGRHGVNVAIKVFRDTYVDSVAQLGAIRAMREVDGVDWASAAMGTPANMEILRDRGRRPRRDR